MSASVFVLPEKDETPVHPINQNDYTHTDGAVQTTRTNSVVSTAFPAAKVPLLQLFVYRFLQCIGFYPRSVSSSYSITRDSKHSQLPPDHPLRFGLVLWTTFIVAVALLGAATFFISDWDTRRQQMANLEFFALVNFVFALSDLTQSPLLLLLIVWKSRKLIPLVHAIEDLLNKVMSGKEIKKLQLIVYPLFAWHLTSIIAIIFSEFEYTRGYLERSSMSINWTTQFPFPASYFGVLVPAYSVPIWNSLCMIIFMNCQWAQYLLVILVFALASVCNCIQNHIGNLSNHLSKAQQLATLRGARLNFRKVKSLINKLNGFFSMVILISSLRDLITTISFIATLLRRLDRDDGESSVEYADRRNEAVASLVFTYTQTALGFGNAACRLSVLLYCYGREAVIRKRLQCLQADAVEEEVDEECSEFLHELGGMDTAVNGGGFFYVTKEYLAGMIGVLFTYMILIYQTRDSKGDMIQLMKSKDIRASLNRLTVDFSKSVTAAAQRACAS